MCKKFRNNQNFLKSIFDSYKIFLKKILMINIECQYIYPPFLYIYLPYFDTYTPPYKKLANCEI